MPKKNTKVVDIKPKLSQKKINLDSGRSIKTISDENEDILEIKEADGKLVLKVRLTEDGPVMVLDGAKLELNASKKIALNADQVDIKTKEDINIISDSRLNMVSLEEMKIHSDNDIRVTGKIIHLN